MTAESFVSSYQWNNDRERRNSADDVDTIIGEVGSRRKVRMVGKLPSAPTPLSLSGIFAKNGHTSLRIALPGASNCCIAWPKTVICILCRAQPLTYLQQRAMAGAAVSERTQSGLCAVAAGLIPNPCHF